MTPAAAAYVNLCPEAPDLTRHQKLANLPLLQAPSTADVRPLLSLVCQRSGKSRGPPKLLLWSYLSSFSSSSFSCFPPFVILISFYPREGNVRGLCSQSALQRSVELHPPRGRGRSIDRSWSGRKRRSSCERASERGRKRRGDDGSERSSRQKNIDRIWPPRQKEEEKKKKRSGFPVFTRKERREGGRSTRSSQRVSEDSE